jgi:hypothetical protein
MIDLIKSEQKMIEKMNSSAQLATISSIFSTFTAAQQNVVSLRQQMLGKVQEYIQSPAKKYLSDQTPIRVCCPSLFSRVFTPHQLAIV